MINKYTPIGKIKNKHLLTLLDYSKEEIFEILHLAKKLKAEYKAGKKHNFLNERTVALVFEKSSTRTRLSFEQGVRQLGGIPLFLSSNDLQLGRGEPISDTVKVFQSYGIDAIMIRTFEQEKLNQLVKHGTIPIINGLTDDFHPCQALADILTIWEVFGKLEGLKLAYLGDGNNVASSLLLAGCKCGMEVVCCTPKGYEPNASVVKAAGSLASVTSDIDIALKGADIVYTDVFLSMGQEGDKGKIDALMPYQVNESVMQKANKNAIFLHCLPAKRGLEVTSEVIDGEQSLVFPQAENRLHAQKAVMVLLI